MEVFFHNCISSRNSHHIDKNKVCSKGKFGVGHTGAYIQTNIHAVIMESILNI